MSSVVVTQRAAERWASIVEPGKSLDESSRRIEELWPAAARLGWRTSRDRDEVWKTSGPVAGLVVKRERGRAIVVTVLPEHAVMPFEPDPIEPGASFRRMTIELELDWLHVSGDLETVELELRRFVTNRVRELRGRGTESATIEGVAIVDRGHDGGRP